MAIRRLTVSESEDVTLTLSEDEADALARAGRELASSSSWWGDDASSNTERSVIVVRHVREQCWSVRVVDAVGLIAVGDCQIAVRPKIPLNHLLHLFAASGRFPRISTQPAQADVSESLWALVAKWYVIALERLLRRDLLRDYQPVRDRLVQARGRLDALQTGSDFYSGRLAFTSSYHEFTRDMPANRVLLGAARIVRGSSALDHGVRRDARRSIARMDEVGGLRRSDLRHHFDRRLAYYRDALMLAHHVIRAAGRSFAHGSAIARTFLIRTPEMVEDGVRAILQRSLSESWHVDKRGRQVPGTTMTFNPDLVFNGGLATGDVKYKLVSGDWSRMRGDLYQAIAFGTLYRATDAMMIRFRTNEAPSPPAIAIGDLSVTTFEWDARPGVAPEEAADAMGAEIALWLRAVAGRRDSWRLGRPVGC